jgi:hypothetical protein
VVILPCGWLRAGVPICLLGGHKSWHNRDGVPAAASSGGIASFTLGNHLYYLLEQFEGHFSPRVRLSGPAIRFVSCQHFAIRRSVCGESQRWTFSSTAER